jgi:hypothetical protein
MTPIRALYARLGVVHADFSDFEVFNVPCDRYEEACKDSILDRHGLLLLTYSENRFMHPHAQTEDMLNKTCTSLRRCQWGCGGYITIVLSFY